MREIKFRGKRLDTGEWVCGDLIHGDISSSVYIKTDVYEDRPFEVDPTTVGQYTGLHEKNGREIYEGDLFSWGVYTGEVFYEDGLWLFDRAEPKGLVPCYNQGVVIGTIHDNPELIPVNNTSQTP